MNTKTYPIVDGLVGDEGENFGRISVVAVLEPDLNYPEAGLIIVGSPRPMQSYEPNLAQFSGSPDAIEKLAKTLLLAVAELRAIGR